MSNVSNGNEDLGQDRNGQGAGLKGLTLDVKSTPRSEGLNVL